MIKRDGKGPLFYILGADHKVQSVKNIDEWAERFEPFDQRVAINFFGHKAIGEIQISTVFLGIDHRFWGEGPPIVFETMIFGGGKGIDGYTDRCSTWDEAVVMHARAVELVKKAFNDLVEASGA